MTKTFSKILIANRGEIANRIIRTCKKLGIQTVAIYSEADESEPFVLAADEAYCVGPPPSIDSYLKIDNIIQIAINAKVDAVHPGFGFLSENAQFASELHKADIKFIGPDSYAVKVMGDKIESKAIAINANVPCIPGYNQTLENGKDALKQAKIIGLPVMLKAAAGGGGKGMRFVFEESEIEASFETAQREALSSFNDGRIFIEKYLVNPRHIEIQVLFDHFKNAVYLNERECSIQRRNQKIIEEAPSLAVDSELRSKMGAAALSLGHAVDYKGAGTVEFMVDEASNFYFLEMNTRLQVEHPVTEMITGIDIVEEQIKIAADQKLSYQQQDIGINGWAIESRIYSEDPRNDFLPSIGNIFHYQEPEGDNVRVDSGIDGGSEVSLYYDPMIAKLITWGESREVAQLKMAEALKNYQIKGVTTNIDFLIHIIEQEAFKKGRLNTSYINDNYPNGFNELELEDEQKYQVFAIGAWNWLNCNFYHLNQDGQTTIMLKYQGEAAKITCQKNGNTFLIEIGKNSYEIQYEGLRFKAWKTLTINGKKEIVRLEQNSLGVMVCLGGVQTKLEVYTLKEFDLLQWMPAKKDPATADEVIAPMPGKVVKVFVEAGMHFKKGHPIAILEAMKMENPIILHKAATIQEVLVKENQNVEAGEMMFKLLEE